MSHALDRLDFAPDDALRSLWATEAAFRFLTLIYSLFIHVTAALEHYTRPHLASALIAFQCMWTGYIAYSLYIKPRWRTVLVSADLVVTLALMYSTWVVAPMSWWDHNQSLPTTMWATNAVLCAGMQWGMRGGFLGAIAIGVASLHIGDDLSWLERSPTLPIMVSAGLAAGVGGNSVRRSHAQLVAALELRAAAAERERLARKVHDGVLQVLALTARETSDERPQLASMAREQERQLRALIATSDEAAASFTSSAATPQHQQSDVRARLLDLASDSVCVSAGAQAVILEAHRADEILATVEQCLANTRNHAGTDAKSFVLLEDLGDNVVITVRDDGSGIAPGRLDEARCQGRLGVSQSICGRIADLGGMAELFTDVGEGVEWEFTVPKQLHETASARQGTKSP